MEVSLKTIKDYLAVKFNLTQLEELAKPIIEQTPAKLAEAETQDGKKISYEGETPAVGAKINEVTNNGMIPLADGEYILKDGTNLTVAGGLITEVESAAAEKAEPVDPAMPAEMATLKTQMSEQKTSFEKSVNDIKAEMIELKKANQFLAQSLKTILDTPLKMSADKSAAVEKPDFSKMTASQEAQWYKDNGINIYEKRK